jgi:hypothetical protein
MGSQTSAFLGGGHMGERMRALDWSATSPGPQERWPPALLTLVRVMLNSRQPMFIAWGADRTLVYNDIQVRSRINSGLDPNPAARERTFRFRPKLVEEACQCSSQKRTCRVHSQEQFSVPTPP